MLLLDKFLLNYSKKVWVRILIIVLLRLITLVGMTKFAIMLAKALANIHDGNIYNLIGMSMLVSLVILISSLLQGELEYQVQAKIRRLLREEIVQKLLVLDCGQIEKIGPTASITASLDAVEMALPYITTYIPSLLFSCLAPVYLFLEIQKDSLWIASLLFVVAWILLPLHNVFRRKIEKIRRKYWQSLESMARVYLDGLRGMTTLKIFNQVINHKNKLQKYATALSHDINTFMKINFTSFLVTEAIMYTCLFVVIISSLKINISLAKKLSFLLMGYAYFASIRTLMTATHEALTALSAAQKIQWILEQRTERKYMFSKSLAQKGLFFKDVSFNYPNGKDVVKNLSFHLKPNEVLALVGLSGCGKSTIASLMMRFLDPSSGNIYLDGCNYKMLLEEDLRQKIVMVPQTVHIFAGTVRDNLQMANKRKTDDELWAILVKVKLADFIKNLKGGLDAQLSENGASLSGGQKQKIGLARALLSDASYLIFDEATSAVDPQNEDEIWKTIHAMFHTKTMLIISHRLSTIKKADRILVLKDGLIQEEGSHEELMKKGAFYAYLVNEQQRLERGYYGA